MYGARPAAPTRPPEASLGRAVRGLIGPAARSGGASGSTTRSAGRGPSLAERGLRSSRRIVTPARAAGLLGMLAAGFLFTLVTGPTAFGLSRTDVPELTWTDEATLRGALGLTEGGNVVRLDTAPLEEALLALPAVAGANVSVALPDAAVVVGVVERTPVLAWQVRDRRFIADARGTIFAVVDAAAPLPAGVAVVLDQRRASLDAFAIGGQIDALDLDVATRLGSLDPGTVGSSATALRVAVNDPDGFVLSTARGWTAVFGFYSPATRPTDMIPGQVRLLRSLLVGREATIRRIILASETDGTYVPRDTPRPTRG